MSRPGRPVEQATGPPTRDLVRGSAPRTAAAALVWPIALVVATATCFAARTGGEWAAGFAIIAWFVVIDRLLGMPPRQWMPRPVQWLLPLSVLAGLGAVIALPDRGAGWTSAAPLVGAAVFVGLVGLGVWSRAAYRGLPTTAVLRFPLDDGSWRVVEGEARALNHHWSVPAQRAALDLVRVGGNAMSHRGVRPARAGEFFAYGTPVHSPCDGVVVDSHDGADDTSTRGVHPAGNHVVLGQQGAPGHDGVQIVLAHLAKGSVTATAGATVRAGDVLGRVGNSGNSTEPHLHIHAQRSGRPVRLRFAGRSRRLPRGATVVR